MSAEPTRCNTHLEQLASLDINTDARKVRLTKIICSIGPKATKEMIKDLVLAGMNIARLNFSHDSHREHEERINMIREAVKELKNETKLSYPVAIALDTKGPEIRTGTLEKGIRNEIKLKTGNQVKLTVSADEKYKCTDKQIYINYQNLPKVLAVGVHNIYINDGKIILKPTKIEGNTVICEISQGGLLGSRKGVVLPGVDLKLPVVSEQDRLDLEFGLKHNVDIIFASFVQDAAGIRAVRAVLGETGARILVVAKIETQKALEHIDEIIEASDGVMVARGDLAVHTPITRVFRAQKSVIAKCVLSGKPVICATQMLESMMDGVRPSRADVSDIANAVLDGADGVMLSGETAVGDYPVRCVETMAEICQYAEMSIWHTRVFEELTAKSLEKIEALNAKIAVSQSMLIGASAIITPIEDLVPFVMRCRPHCPVILITKREGKTSEISRRLLLTRGGYAFNVRADIDVASKKSIQLCIEYATNKGIVTSNDIALKLSFSDCKTNTKYLKHEVILI